MPSLLHLLVITLTTFALLAHAAPIPVPRPISIPLPAPGEDYHREATLFRRGGGTGRGWIPTEVEFEEMFGKKEVAAVTLPVRSTPLPALLRRLVPFLQSPPSSPAMPVDLISAAYTPDDPASPEEEDEETGEVASSVQRRRVVRRRPEDWESVDGRVGRPTGADVALE